MDGGAVNTPDWRSKPSVVLRYLLVLVGALIPICLLILIAGFNPATAIITLLKHTLGTANGLSEVVVRSIPLTLTGLGIVVAFRAKIFNVGGDGQIIFGGLAFTTCALALREFPGWMVMPIALGGGMLGGAIYGGIAGALRARYSANEIIVTILLNYIAFQFLTWAIRGPLQENAKVFPRSDLIPDAAVLGRIFGDGRLHWGVAIALIATIIVHVVLEYSSFGFQLRAVGESPAAARFAGMNDKAVIFLSLAIGGGLAGLAGAVEISGIHGRLQDAFAEGTGITAIAVALLARLNAAFVPLTALLFGILSVGTGALQRKLGVPFPLVHMIEAVVILTFLVVGYLQGRRKTA